MDKRQSETWLQATLRADDPKLFDVLTDFIPVIQQALDRGRQCDDTTVAAGTAGSPYGL